MSAKDAFHDIVVDALEDDGWRITHDPLYLAMGGVEMYVDLGAEPLIAAERQDNKIAIEVKGFTKKSKISEFHTAVGQFMNYRRALKKKEPERHLYLAVPLDVYNSFFNLEFIQESIVDYELHIIVYDVEEKVIAEWIN